MSWTVPEQPPTLSTASQVVKIRTRRGVLTIGPHGRLNGLWRIVERELRTSEQVRAMCAGVKRRRAAHSGPINPRTLQAWREHDGFPAPVLRLRIGAATVDLWSRSEVEDWLDARAQRV